MINLSYTEGRTRAAAAVPKSSPTLSHRLQPVSFFVSYFIFFVTRNKGTSNTKSDNNFTFSHKMGKKHVLKSVSMSRPPGGGVI